MSGATAAGQPAGFVPGLAMSRGVAALMVALLHAGQATYANGLKQPAVLLPSRPEPGSCWLWEDALRMLGNGHGAVNFFFVLSGFVLALMIQRGPPDIASSARSFFIGRIFRLYPAVIVTVLAIAGLYWATGRGLAAAETYAPFNVLLNALLLRTDIDGVMWTLQLEMIAAPLIFFGYWGWRRWGAPILIVPHLLFLALSFAPGFYRFIGLPSAAVPAYAFTGGLITSLYARPLIERLRPSGPWLGVFVAGFLLSRPLLGWWSPWAILFEVAFAGGAVAMIAWGTFAWRGNTRLAALARYYGRISYSFYLLHPISLIVIYDLQEPLGAAISAGAPPWLLMFGLFIGSTAVVTPLAHLQYRFVEQPGIALGRAWQRSRRPVTPVYDP